MTIRLMIDTNIFIDVFAKRDSFYMNSKKVLELCENKNIIGFVSASNITDIYYLIRRITKSSLTAYDAIGSILNIVKVVSVTNNDVEMAYIQKAKDFEDCLLATCAKSNNVKGIITRNKSDFESFGIDLYSPEEIINIISNS